LLTSAVFGDALKTQMNVPVAIKDSFQRLFQINLQSLTAVNTAGTTLDTRMQNYALPLFAQTIAMGDHISLGLSSIPNPEQSPIQDPTSKRQQEDTTRVGFTLQSEKSEMAMQYNIPVAQGFGLGTMASLNIGEAVIQQQAVTNPFLSLAEKGSGLWLGLD